MNYTSIGGLLEGLEFQFESWERFLHLTFEMPQMELYSIEEAYGGNKSKISFIFVKKKEKTTFPFFFFFFWVK